jgi:DNA-binding NarL/FixJ family response regulator
MSFSVWTGASAIRVIDSRVEPWTPVEFGADAIRWLLKRKIHVRPLLTLDEATVCIERASDAQLIQLAKRMRLSGSHESIRAQVLARLGAVPTPSVEPVVEPVADINVVDVVEPVVEPVDDVDADTSLDSRRSFVYELRESGETWSQIAHAMEISEGTARRDYAIWQGRVE